MQLVTNRVNHSQHQIHICQRWSILYWVTQQLTSSMSTLPFSLWPKTEVLFRPLIAGLIILIRLGTLIVVHLKPMSWLGTVARPDHHCASIPKLGSSRQWPALFVCSTVQLEQDEQVPHMLNRVGYDAAQLSLLFQPQSDESLINDPVIWCDLTSIVTMALLPIFSLNFADQAQ